MGNKLFFEGRKLNTKSNYSIIPFNEIGEIEFDGDYYEITVYLKRDGQTRKFRCKSKSDLDSQLESYRMYLSGDIKEKIKI